LHQEGFARPGVSAQDKRTRFRIGDKCLQCLRSGALVGRERNRIGKTEKQRHGKEVEKVKKNERLFLSPSAAFLIFRVLLWVLSLFSDFFPCQKNIQAV
jgi:hypothetical protein